ncbi:hypothetical protein [Nitratidesulfovibrio sp.]|uniref:hypothetical protein n=1 Tax=Nitratidesulfovibrio sp. TaxID=2802297 RepID=UPI00334067A0
MTQFGKRTVQFPVTPEEVPALVSRIGEQMAAGVITLDGRSIEIEGYESIGISLKRTGDKLRARVKVKFPKRPGEVGDAGSDADDSDGDDD